MVEAPEEPEPPEPPEPLTDTPEKPQNRTLEWFSKNPVFGVIGFLVGVVSLTATFYFGIATLRSRDLSLTVDPTRTTIVKAGQSSDLHVLYKGQSVATDVTGLQVAIWNAGRESIRSEHILSSIILETSPKIPILEVRLRHISRPVCAIALDESQLADGKVGLTWRILEHNDGAIIQFIVAGGSNTTMVGQGSMEGDSTVKLVPMTKTIPFWLVGVSVGFSGVCAWFARLLMGERRRSERFALEQASRDLHGVSADELHKYAGQIHRSDRNFFLIMSVVVALMSVSLIVSIVIRLMLSGPSIPLFFD